MLDLWTIDRFFKMARNNQKKVAIRLFFHGLTQQFLHLFSFFAMLFEFIEETIKPANKKSFFDFSSRRLNWEPKVKISTKPLYTVSTIVSPNGWWKTLVVCFSQFCCDHRIQSFPKSFNHENVKNGPLSPISL